MERRISSRAPVDVPVSALVDGFRHACRALEISPTGMLIERARLQANRDLPMLSPFEIHLDGDRPIRARARPVWIKDRLAAVRFVWMSDADRLTIAEMLDRKVRLGERLH